MKQAILILCLLLATDAAAGDSYPVREPLDDRAVEDHFLRDARVLDDVEAASGEKSVGKAVLYSLLLPGTGHYYVDDRGLGNWLLAIDGAIWTSCVVFLIQGYQREQNYQEYAQVFAGVTRDDHSDDYYRVLTEYNSFRQYEDEIKNEGRRELFPDVDTASLDAYFVENRVGDYEPWVWQSAYNRRVYQDRRSASKRAYRRALYSVALALANRAAASFLAVKSTREYNRRVRGEETGFRLELETPAYYPARGLSARLALVRRF